MHSGILSAAGEQIGVLAAMRRDMREAQDFIAGRLSDASFDNISPDESFLLGVIARIPRSGATGTLSKLGVTKHEVSQLIGNLSQRGYMRLRDKAANRGKPAAILTERGRAAITLAENAVKASHWADFPLRQDDIIISTPVKCGTTWAQMICALLIFQNPDLPAPLQDLSPWLDGGPDYWRETADALAAQKHRRFIKTHLPLSELPADDKVTYIVVARNLLDAGISFHYHISKVAARTEDVNEPRSQPSPRNWLVQWIASDTALSIPREHLLPGMLQHLAEAWARRNEPNVILLHYEELSADLEGEMRRLAAHLGITVPDASWPALVKAATFDGMRAVADRIQPEPCLKDAPESFFRKGISGTGCDLLTDAELAYYHARTAQLAPPDFLAWLHRTSEAV